MDGVNKIGQVDSLNEHMDIRTYGQTQAGPAFQDLMSGWIQPQSDNDCMTVCVAKIIQYQ